jgi:hypothetical protein
MTIAEKERAMIMSKHQYPQSLLCANCLQKWMAHKGTMCPHPLVGTNGFLSMGWFPGETTFIPIVDNFDGSPLSH